MSVVYFVRPEKQDGKIKIGSTSNLRQRIATYGRSEILAVVPGGLKIERAFQKELSGSCFRGEWFHASAEVYAVINRVIAESGGAAAMDKIIEKTYYGGCSRLTVYLTPEQDEALNRIVKRDGRTKTAIIGRMIEAGDAVRDMFPVCNCGADRTGPSAESHASSCPAGG